MSVVVVFETHSTSEDNERAVASGWLPSRLSARGRFQAEQLGRRRRDEDLAAVFSSDLNRAMETVSLAFAVRPVPRFVDWRLRECHFGQRNGESAATLHADRAQHLDRPYPGGESWRQAVHRVQGLLTDITDRWAGTRVLIVGHAATRWALEHHANGIPLEQLAGRELDWRPGWTYQLPLAASARPALDGVLADQPGVGPRAGPAGLARSSTADHDPLPLTDSTALPLTSVARGLPAAGQQRRNQSCARARSRSGCSKGR